MRPIIRARPNGPIAVKHAVEVVRHNHLASDDEATWQREGELFSNAEFATQAVEKLRAEGLRARVCTVRVAY